MFMFPRWRLPRKHGECLFLVGCHPKQTAGQNVPGMIIQKKKSSDTQDSHLREQLLVVGVQSLGHRLKAMTLQAHRKRGPLRAADSKPRWSYQKHQSHGCTVPLILDCTGHPWMLGVHGSVHHHLWPAHQSPPLTCWSSHLLYGLQSPCLKTPGLEKCFQCPSMLQETEFCTWGTMTLPPSINTGMLTTCN